MVRNDIYQRLDSITCIVTERLVLKRLTPRDAAALYLITHDPRVSQYLLWDPHPTLGYTKSYLKNLNRLYKNHIYYEWGVYLKENHTLIGTCGFTAFHFLSKSAEIGYSFGTSYWGHGYATEAVTAALSFGFRDLSIKHIDACYALVNTASGRVLEKCGMTYMGECDPMIIKNHEYRVGLYRMTREDYFTLQEKKNVATVGVSDS